MSAQKLIIALVLVTTAVVTGYLVYEHSLLSPFAVGSVRAGMRFDDADDDARRGLGHGYLCRAVGGGARVCEVVTEGPSGIMKQVVDRSGRVALVEFQLGEYSPTSQEAGRRLIADWNRIGRAETMPMHAGTSLTFQQWQSADGRWSAAMLWQSSSDTPYRLTLTDTRRLRDMEQSTEGIHLALAKQGILDSQDTTAIGIPHPAVGEIVAVRDSVQKARAVAEAKLVPGDTIARVTVCVERRGSTSVYHYSVRNGDRALLRVIEIGYADSLGPDSLDTRDWIDRGGELSELPVGIDSAIFEVPIRSSALSSPANWLPEFERVEETRGFLISWYAQSNEFGIQPGEERDGFAVAVAHSDTGYESGHWTLLADAPGATYVGQLRRVEGPCHK